jgi:acetyltransferase-like isoleucine patch superfamily enzyme
MRALRSMLWSLIREDALMELSARQRQNTNAGDSDLGELTNLVNVLGRNVTIGRNVVMFGGKSTMCRGIRLHDGVRLYDHCKLMVDCASADSGIVLKDDVALNFNVYIDGSGGVHIEQGTIVGPNVVVVSSDHVPSSHTAIQSSGKVFSQVRIGRNVWIGANACILRGVSIGDSAVVGAGAVVTHDVPERTIVAGNPARVLRQMEAQSMPRS